MTPRDGNWLGAALEHYERPLCRYAARLVGNVETARDIVQDCFLRLCRQPPERVEDHVKEWLYTVCRNRAFDHLRKEGTRMDIPDGTELLAERSSGDPAPSAQAARREDSTILKRCIADLPERQQEILRLKFLEGLSYKQIAAVTEESVSNVGYLLHTAIRALRTRLGGAAPAGRTEA